MTQDQEDEMYADLGREYSIALAKSGRDTLWNLMLAKKAGWSQEQFRRWVDNGEGPYGS